MAFAMTPGSLVIILADRQAARHAGGLRFLLPVTITAAQIKAICEILADAYVATAL
jgi:hypothetical protein